MVYPYEPKGRNSNRPVIDVVSLGAMGGQIASRLLSQANPVYGTNRTKAKAYPLIDRGPRWHDTPRQVTQTADVTDIEALQAVTSGPDGILAGLQPGKINLDMSTISPGNRRELARYVTARGAAMLTALFSANASAATRPATALTTV